MKRVEFCRNFEKAYKKRIADDRKLRLAFDTCYMLFCDGKHGYPLNDHALTGTRKGQRAFSIANDVRVIYIEAEEKIIFLDIGSHNQVY